MIEHSAKLPAGFKVRFIFTDGAMNTEWEPDIPSRALSSRTRNRILTAYMRERNLFAAKVATAINGKVLVADIRDGDIDGLTPIEPGTRH